jgi:transcriptional regulator with XRE-family HTH domain
VVLLVTAMRHQLEISQAELARRSELHNSTLSLVESGRLRPYPSQLEKLAAGLGFAGDPAKLLEPVNEAEAIES